MNPAKDSLFKKPQNKKACLLRQAFVLVKNC